MNVHGNVSRLVLLSIGLLIASSYALEAPESNGPRCESQSWSVQLHRYGMQVVCELSVETSVELTPELEEEESDQVLDADASGDKVANEIEDEDLIEFAMFPITELLELRRTRMVESRSTETNEMMVTFTELTTKQMIMVIVQPFAFWLRFPAHFWSMLDKPKYYHHNHLLIRVRIQEGIDRLFKLFLINVFD
jgi:hypothetical protein